MSKQETSFSYQDGSGFLQTQGNYAPPKEIAPETVKVEVTLPKEKKKKKKPTRVPNKQNIKHNAQSYGGNPYVPTGANSPKGLMKYFKNRNSDTSDKFRAKDSENQEEQTELLRKIEKQRQMGGSGKNSSSFGTKSILGALGLGAIFKGVKKIFNPKKLLGRLSIPTLIMSILDSAKEDIQRIADNQGVELDEVGIATQLQGVINMVGGFGVKVTNKLFDVLGLDEYKIEEDTVRQKTSKLRAQIEEKKNIFIENTGKFGEAVVEAFSVADKGIGQVATYLQKATKEAFDVFRKKSNMEKEFIKAQDTVRNREKFGDTPLIGASDKEYNQALKKMNELAPKLLKDEDFSKNSIYKEVAENTVSGKNDAKRKLINKEEVLQKRKTRQQSLSEDLNHLKDLKEKAEKGEWFAQTEIKARNLLAVSFEKDLKDKAILLERQNKLVTETEEIVKSLKKARKDIDGKKRDSRVNERIQKSKVINTPVNGTLLETISNGEGTSERHAKKAGYKTGYDITLGNGKHLGGAKPEISKMTMKEVFALQKKMKQDPSNRYSIGNGKYAPSSAVGKYQFVEPTLRSTMKRAGLSENDIFSPENQDKMANVLLDDAGQQEYKNGKINSHQYQKKISKIWASVEGNNYGQGIHTSTSTIQKAIKATGETPVAHARRITPIKATPVKKVFKTTTASAQAEQNSNPSKKIQASTAPSVPVANAPEKHPQVQQTPIDKKTITLLEQIVKNTKPSESKSNISLVNQSTGGTLKV
jgi:hypothetical protein